MDLPRVKEHSLGDSGLSGIDMGHKPYISGSNQAFLSSHLSFSIGHLWRILAILKGFF
jgi:hypothetical protein